MKRMLLRKIDPNPFVPADPNVLTQRCRFILRLLMIALAQRLLSVERGTRKREVALALSGGRDSVLSLLITVLAFDYLGWDRKGIKVITLPGPGTTAGTKAIAMDLPAALGTSFLEAEIEEAATAVLRASGHEPCWECLKCENVQARVRTNITMALGFMVGTGDMSEAFKGFCTYAGDHISMYDTNSGLPKTLVSFLIKQTAVDDSFGEKVSAKLHESLALDITPELIKAAGKIIQKTEEIIGPYCLTDFFMRAIVRDGFSPRKTFWHGVLAFDGIYDPNEIVYWLEDAYKRFFANQFKLHAKADGAKVGTLSLSQLSDWRAPADMPMPVSIRNELNAIKDSVRDL